jgi:hypothetical protein
MRQAAGQVGVVHEAEIAQNPADPFAGSRLDLQGLRQLAVVDDPQLSQDLAQRLVSTSETPASRTRGSNRRALRR